MKQIQELALRDEEGRIKDNFYRSVLSALKMKDIDRKYLPPLFYKEINKKESQTANTSIAEVLAFDEDEIRIVFGKASRPVLKSFDVLRNSVVQLPEQFYQCYLKSIVHSVDLEIEPKDTIVDILDRLFQFCKELGNYQLIEEKEAEKLDRLARYFNGEQLSEICILYNESSENTRNLIKNKNIFVDILKGNSTFKLDESIYSLISNYKASFTNNSKFFDHQKLDEHAKELIGRKLEFLDLVIFNFEIDIVRTYITNSDIIPFRFYINAFNQFVKSTEEYYTLAELYLQFDEYYANERVIKDKLENTPDFFAKVVNEFPKLDKLWSEEKKQFVYSTHWNHLANNALKVSRITLDHKDQMSTEEIFTEYNNRNKYWGEELLDNISKFIIKSSSTVHSVQHGYWKYSKEKIEKIDVREVINQFILDQKGVVYFKDVIAHVKRLNYKYPDNSIRAYIQNFARKSANDPNLFVHEDYIESSGIEVFNKRNNLIGKELIPIFHDILKKLKDDIPNNEFYQLIFNECESRNLVLNNKNIVYAYLDRFYKLGILNIDEGSIIASSINIEKLATYEYRPEPNYRKHIRNEAIAILKETSNNRIRIKEIYDQLFHLFPKGVSKTNFYRIFSESDLFSTHEYKGKLYYQLEVDQLPDAKPFTEEVFEPEETIIVDVNRQIVEEIEANVTLEINDEVNITESSTNYNFGLQLNSQQIFDFIFNELGRKYKNAKWFNDGFDDFKKIIGSQSNYDQHWGAKILKSFGRVLVNISDFYDRDSCLQRLSLSFETYLKQFDNLGIDARQNLGEIIKTTNKLNTLLEYSKTNKYQYGDPIYEFSKSLGKIWTYRNTYAHDQESDKLEITISDHIKYIMDFIALYIFIPYYVKN